MALAISLICLLRRAWPQNELSLHYEHRSGGKKQLILGGHVVDVAVLNCRWSPRSAVGQHILVIVLLAALHRAGLKGPARRNRWLRALLNADFIGDIRGGDSFSDIYGVWRFLVGSGPLLSVALLGRPYTLLPQTYGPFRSPLSRWLAKRLLKSASVILTRDKACEPIVKDLCGRVPTYCPDVAFALDAERPQLQPFEKTAPLADEEKCFVGINVSGLLYMGGYSGKNMFGLRDEYRILMHRLADAILRTTSSTVLIVPHVFGSEQEQEACMALFQELRDDHVNRVYALTDELNERELKWIIGRTQMFIGSRMHACIAALSQCVPCVGLAYSDKFLGVFETAGLGDAVIDLRRTPQAEVIAGTLSLFNRRAELRRELEARIPETKAQISAQVAAFLPKSAGRR
jgi:colanic acid/amylovoran biosynthesis protein